MSITIERVKKFLSWLYMQYLLNTTLYVMEPFEKKVFNTVLIASLALSAYSAYVYLPDQFLRIGQRIFQALSSKGSDG